MGYINKFVNDPDNIVEETVNGYAKAYKGLLKKLNNTNVIARDKQTTGKVGIVIGNGSGHEPACLGFVGENLLDCNAYGELFAAPGPFGILDAIQEADTGNGVLVLISAHAGDVLNSKMAIDMAIEDGHQVDSALIYDDVASAPKDYPHEERRGSIGTIFSYKMAGSYSSEMTSLKDIKAFTEKVRDNTRTICSARKPGSSPITGEKMFELEAGEVLVGLGVHGESARIIYKNETSKEIATGMLEELTSDIVLQSGDEVSIIVNNMGSTTMMELMIFFGTIEKILTSKGIKIYKPLIGTFITTQEMAGIGLSICKMDDEMKKQWSKETNAPHFPKL